jgi:EAL domain-containing protein (putative c-di-GMP-specific phosphodiesterase class I)
VGVVLFPDHGTNTEELLARADLAMYRAKEQGRNQYCLYRPDEDWQAELQSRFDWSLLIENALRNDRFLVYAQPVINLATGEIDRHELLIRMEAADGSVIPPGMFLTVAERTGQIAQIDQWMVRRAIDLISMRGGDGRPCCLDVNLSGRAFSDPGLLPLIESELMRTGIDPAQFGVEITETAAVSDMGKAREFIETLKRLGCRVALDDFGSGFSSFYYLRNLPIDCLKIDGSFIQNMYSNKQDQHVVRAIVELAAGFGISSTAEFVEDGKTLDLLREFGVTYAQGFHIAEPGPSWGDTLTPAASA